MPIKHTLNNKQNRIIEPVYCEDCKYGYMLDEDNVCRCPEMRTIKRHPLYKSLDEVKYANPRLVNMNNNCTHYKKDYLRLYVLKIIIYILKAILVVFIPGMMLLFAYSVKN